jgi:hypothetical protein
MGKMLTKTCWAAFTRLNNKGFYNWVCIWLVVLFEIYIWRCMEPQTINSCKRLLIVAIQFTVQGRRNAEWPKKMWWNYSNNETHSSPYRHKPSAHIKKMNWSTTVTQDIHINRKSTLHPPSSTAIFHCHIKIFHLSSEVKLDSLLTVHTITIS